MLPGIRIRTAYPRPQPIRRPFAAPDRIAIANSVRKSAECHSWMAHPALDGAQDGGLFARHPHCGIVVLALVLSLLELARLSREASLANHPTWAVGDRPVLGAPPGLPSMMEQLQQVPRRTKMSRLLAQRRSPISLRGTEGILLTIEFACLVLSVWLNACLMRSH
jgi:hypothetical protein